jgi:hypothetical protein
MSKEWSWSYSKLKNFRTCAYRHQQIDLDKNFVEEQDPNGPLAWGNAVHAALAATLGNGVPLPAHMRPYQKWVEKIKNRSGKLYVEQKYAIDRNFQKTEYFAPNVWFRGIADAVVIDGTVGVVSDFKTGKLVVDSVQLMLMAQCLFAHFPELQRVGSEFIWLAEDAMTPEVYTRQDVAHGWIGLLDHVAEMENAFKTKVYPKKPSGLCRNYCPVRDCEFYKRGGR